MLAFDSACLTSFAEFAAVLSPPPSTANWDESAVAIAISHHASSFMSAATGETLWVCTTYPRRAVSSAKHSIGPRVNDTEVERDKKHRFGSTSHTITSCKGRSGPPKNGRSAILGNILLLEALPQRVISGEYLDRHHHRLIRFDDDLTASNSIFESHRRSQVRYTTTD